MLIIRAKIAEKCCLLKRVCASAKCAPVRLIDKFTGKRALFWNKEQ